MELGPCRLDNCQRSLCAGEFDQLVAGLLARHPGLLQSVLALEGAEGVLDLRSDLVVLLLVLVWRGIGSWVEAEPAQPFSEARGGAHRVEMANEEVENAYDLATRFRLERDAAFLRPGRDRDLHFTVLADLPLFQL